MIRFAPGVGESLTLPTFSVLGSVVGDAGVNPAAGGSLG
jgi:hypothetical protein